jgi:dipeptidase
MCDTVVAVGGGPDGGVTGDGAVWFGKNSDREPDEAQVIEHLPAGDEGDVVQCTHLAIPGAGRSREVVLSRPAWMWGAEMGVNDAGVAIGNEAVFTREKLDEVGLTGMDLLRLALQRSSSAREAVDVITGLLKRHGQGGRMGYRNAGFRYSSSFLIADGGEAWVLETAGRLWAAERVTRGVRTISNALSIGRGADLVDDDAVQRAVAKGRCRGRADIDFAGAFKDPVMSALAGADARRACTARALGGGAVDVDVVAAALRDHGDDDTPRGGLVMRSPCAHASWLPTRAAGQTTASLIARLAPGEPPRVWATGTSSPCLSVFKPVPLATGRLLQQPHPAGVAMTTGDDASLWWRHERLHRAVLARGLDGGSFADERRALEARIRDDVDHADDAWESHREAVVRWREALPAGHPRGPFPGFWRRREAALTTTTATTTTPRTQR